MKEITIKLYEYDELSPTAKEKARLEFVQHNYDPDLEERLTDALKDELDKSDFEYDPESIKVHYSLSNSQGDGFMFEGELKYEGFPIAVQHYGHYSHSYSKQVIWGANESEGEELDSEYEKNFEQEYQRLCRIMERFGYDEIEYQESEEYFRDMCEANEWTFEEDGTMRNA